MQPRRGLAHGFAPSDQDARATNLTMVQQKRKRQLEEQLESKEQLMRQYTNPRGIGMGGRPVPEEDVRILHEQIDHVRRQLAELTGAPIPAPSAPLAPALAAARAVPSAAGSPPQNGQPLQHSSPVVQNQQQVPRLSGTPASSGGFASRPGSRRDDAWQRKYDRWRHAVGVAAAAGPTAQYHEQHQTVTQQQLMAQQMLMAQQQAMGQQPGHAAQQHAMTQQHALAQQHALSQQQALTEQQMMVAQQQAMAQQQMAAQQQAMAQQQMAAQQHAMAQQQIAAQPQAAQQQSGNSALESQEVRFGRRATPPVGSGRPPAAPSAVQPAPLAPEAHAKPDTPCGSSMPRHGRRSQQSTSLW